MPYRGHIKNGVVVLDEPTPLKEGDAVTIDRAVPRTVEGEPLGPFRRLFADEADLLDRVVAEALESRENRRFRRADG